MAQYGCDAAILAARLEKLSTGKNLRLALQATELLLNYLAGRPDSTLNLEVSAGPAPWTAVDVALLTDAELAIFAAINARLRPDTAPLLAVSEAPPFEQAPDGRHDPREHIRNICRRQQRGGTEAHVRAVSGKHPVDHERINVYIEIRRPAEALNDRDGSAAAVNDPSHMGHMPWVLEDRPNGDAHDRAARLVVPRQPVPTPRRERQHPLPHRHRWEHVVYAVPRPCSGKALSNVEGPQLAHTALPLHEWDAPVQPTVITAEAGKAAARHAQRSNSRHSCSTNWGSPSPARRPAACARKLSKRSRTTWYTTPCDGIRGS